MDFDDLILLTVRLFAERPEVRERYGRQYQYLLVDEYQDTNRPQYDLIQDLTCVHQNITAVGDEDQSIYGFRGADIENILRFESDFKNAVVIKLEENYRSTQTILSAATSVVSHNRRRKGKVLWTRNGEGAPLELYAASTPQDEARQVARRIAGHLRRQEGPAVVLYRTNFQSRQFEESLREVRIPYKVVGSVSFFDRKEVKDALAYLRVTANPEDSVALLRIINEPPRGIGATTLARLNEAARDKNVSLWGAVQGGLTGRDFAARTHLALQRLTELIETQRQRLAFPLHELLQGVLEASGYLSALKTEATPEAEERILNLRELVTLASEYSNRGQTLQEFLDQAMLHTDADDYDEKAQVSLMTLHNAKGLEFPIVFMVGLEEGTFPHSRCSTPDDIEEERRLCYVGMTRAQNALYLSYSQGRRFYSSDLPASNPPSRFLQAIPKQLIRGPAHGRSEFAAFPRGTFTGVTFDTPDQMRRRLEGMSRPGQGVKGFRPGATVEHGHYGRGRVLQVQETGDDLKITVQFPGVGIKKMLQGFAKLKLV
jgi:DNA helicase-2/ATP-dependent DNA helicase PcrA